MMMMMMRRSRMLLCSIQGKMQRLSRIVEWRQLFWHKGNAISTTWCRFAAKNLVTTKLYASHISNIVTASN